MKAKKYNKSSSKYKYLKKWIIHKNEASLEHRKHIGTIFSVIQILFKYYLMMTTGDAYNSKTVILKKPKFNSKNDAFDFLINEAMNNKLNINMFLNE